MIDKKKTKKLIMDKGRGSCSSAKSLGNHSANVHPKELECWEKELINSGKHLADILEQYNGNRQCKLCGAEPEKQSEWVIFLVKKLLNQQRTELLEEINKLPDLTTTEFGEETISRLEVINLVKK